MRTARGSAWVDAEGSQDAAGGSSSTLDDVMRAPSTNAPGVVVIDGLPDDLTRKEILDPKEDLWLSSADGRYNTPIIPLRVGEPPYMETFYVHKDILLKAAFFKRALCGEFREREAQAIDLPEEDPAIFHFLVAFLYEDRYVPIRPVATVLVADLDKGKGKDVLPELIDSDSDSAGSIVSDSSVRSRRNRERRRRREERHFERMRRKHPGLHRPNCNCPQCLSVGGPPCWHCAAPRVPPPPMHAPLDPRVVVNADRPRRRHGRRDPRDPRDLRGGPAPPTADGSPLDPSGGDRIRGDDMATWLLTYELNLDVYICANKFLMDDFKHEIARACIDMLESAGSDAAQLDVLRSCKKLYQGLSEADPLLKMIYARVGFLQPMLWRRAPQETSEFLVCNPEVGALILKETASRREDDFNGRTLPSMERSWFPPPPVDPPYIPRVHPRARW